MATNIVKGLMCVSSLAALLLQERHGEGHAIDPQEVLAQVRSRLQSFENLHVESIWEDYRDGQLFERSLQILDADRLGRVRARCVERYRVSPTGAEERVDDVDELYDGALYVTAGRPYARASNASAAGAETRSGGPWRPRHWNVSTEAGLGSRGMGPLYIRQPHTVVAGRVIRALEEAVAMGSVVKVVAVPSESNDVMEVTVPEAATGGSIIALVDRTRGFVVPNARALDE